MIERKIMKNINQQELKLNILLPLSIKKTTLLKEVDSLALANAQLNLEKAFKNFLKNKDFGFPRYKCKSNPVQSYTTNNQNTIYIKNGYIKLPKLKSLVKIKLHREIKGIIKSATISKNSLDHYLFQYYVKKK